MTTYDSIKASFKALLQGTAFEKITVSDICRAAGISRKTFYVYFRDKSDVMEKIIYDNLSKPIYDLHHILSSYDSAPFIVLEMVYQIFHADRDFYEKISSYIGQNSFQDIMIEQTTAINLEILTEYDLPQDEKEYMAYYYAAAHTMLLIKWLRDKMTLHPKTIAAYYEKWGLRYWHEIYKKKQKR